MVETIIQNIEKITRQEAEDLGSISDPIVNFLYKNKDLQDFGVKS